MKSRTGPQNLLSVIFRGFWFGRQPKRWREGWLVGWLRRWREGWRLGQPAKSQEGQGAIKKAVPVELGVGAESGVFEGMKKGGEVGQALQRLDTLYAHLPGGKHAQLVRFQEDMAGLCASGHLVPVALPDGRVLYPLAGHVQACWKPYVISVAWLRELHRQKLRESVVARRLN